MRALIRTVSGLSAKKRFSLLVGVTVVIAVLVFVARETNLMQTVDAVVARLREAGPAVFFVAMALLPAVGFPMMAFTLAAGPLFGPIIGSGWVVVWSLGAVVGNLLLTYWLADHALRPLVSRLLNHFSFRLPESRGSTAWQMTLIVRLTPGPPYWVQSYLLGLIRVSLWPYLVISTLVMAGYIVALVYGGEAIANGNGRLAFAAVGGLVASVVLLQLLRKWSAQRKEAVALKV